ncbi:trigger factor [Spelaeicoccus albus]|uniref:Trigger factor n=1 Tax=Spelaeicoccus albus TaxID=1280376 RepID=A0A7Z0D4V3_9MICO|nr:trigger factor [Spelaeicoccus albus]NYI68924.1 trigger factor [Spelaeicoccus albus]
MKSAVETLNPTRVKLSVEVPFDELKPNIDKAYKSISEQVQVPGFRKGKVPARIIDQRVGRPAVLQEAVNDGLDGFFREAVDEHELRPLGTPEVEVSEIPGLDGSDEGELSFTVEVDVRPTVELPDYATLKVEVAPLAVTDDDVAKALDGLRERFGTLSTVDRPAAADDFVTLDLTASIDGVEVDSASGVSYQIGSETMLDGMDEALTGLSADEETTFETTLAGGEHEGETAQVKVSVSNVKERELPEADDEFAQLASEFDTIDELKEDLKSQAGKDKEFEQGIEARDKLLDTLLDAIEIPVPEKIVEEQVHEHLEREDRLNDDEHRTEVTEETQKGLRTQFLLDAVAEAEEVEVSQQELIEYLISTAQQYNMNPNEFAKMIDESGQVPAMVSEVGRRKALAAVLAQVSVVDTAGNAVDLTNFVTPAEEAGGADDEADDSEADDAGEPDDGPAADDPGAVRI